MCVWRQKKNKSQWVYSACLAQIVQKNICSHSARHEFLDSGFWSLMLDLDAAECCAPRYQTLSQTPNLLWRAKLYQAAPAAFQSCKGILTWVSVRIELLTSYGHFINCKSLLHFSRYHRFSVLEVDSWFLDSGFWRFKIIVLVLCFLKVPIFKVEC